MTMSDTITKDQLAGKPLAQWSEEEHQVAEELDHTLTLSYSTVKRIAERGDKTQSWDQMIRDLLEDADD